MDNNPKILEGLSDSELAALRELQQSWDAAHRSRVAWYLAKLGRKIACFAVVCRKILTFSKPSSKLTDFVM